jgi:hypothetical protein
MFRQARSRTEPYGQGHEQASGGALRIEQWLAFLDSLGFRAPTLG